MLSNPDTKDVFSTIHGNAQNHISSLGHISMIFLDFVMDGIHENERINGFERAILPGCHFRHDFLRDFGHQFGGNLHVVQFFDLLGNISLAHAAGVQRQNFVFHAISIAAVLADDFRLVLTVAVTGNLNIDFSQLGLDLFLGISIAVVSGLLAFRIPALAALSSKFLIQFNFHNLLDHIPEHFFHRLHDIGCAGEALALNVFLQ